MPENMNYRQVFDELIRRVSVRSSSLWDADSDDSPTDKFYLSEGHIHVGTKTINNSLGRAVIEFDKLDISTESKVFVRFRILDSIFGLHPTTGVIKRWTKDLPTNANLLASARINGQATSYFVIEPGKKTVDITNIVKEAKLDNQTKILLMFESIRGVRYQIESTEESHPLIAYSKVGYRCLMKDVSSDSLSESPGIDIKCTLAIDSVEISLEINEIRRIEHQKIETNPVFADLNVCKIELVKCARIIINNAEIRSVTKPVNVDRFSPIAVESIESLAETSEVTASYDAVPLPATSQSFVWKVDVIKKAEVTAESISCETTGSSVDAIFVRKLAINQIELASQVVFANVSVYA